MTDYLFDVDKDSQVSSFEQIKKDLASIYKKYPNYQLFVTGHSLGGSLAQLTAFMLAGHAETTFIQKPVIAITFASPVVGNRGFLKTFKELENANKLRHIRVSNRHDVVPCAGTGFMRFKQTGVNLHVKDGKMKVKYLNPKSLFSQFRSDSLHSHFLYGEGCYKSRLFRDENKDILNMTIDELYEKYAGIPQAK